MFIVGSQVAVAAQSHLSAIGVCAMHVSSARLRPDATRFDRHRWLAIPRTPAHNRSGTRVSVLVWNCTLTRRCIHVGGSLLYMCTKQDMTTMVNTCRQCAQENSSTMRSIIVCVCAHEVGSGYSFRFGFDVPNCWRPLSFVTKPFEQCMFIAVAFFFCVLFPRS